MRSLRRFSLAVLVVGVLASVVLAQTVDPEFQQARRARNEAIRTGDQATFERYTAENFLAIGPTGVVENKTQRVARANRPLPQNGAVEDEKITPYGNTIVLTWRQGAQGGANRFIEVWAKENGTWKVAAVQITRIEKP